MQIQEAIKELRKITEEYQAPFVSDEFLKCYFPESAKTTRNDELEHIKEILNHDLACLREFMDLANDKLADMTMDENYEIKIVSSF